MTSSRLLSQWEVMSHQSPGSAVWGGKVKVTAETITEQLTAEPTGSCWFDCGAFTDIWNGLSWFNPARSVQSINSGPCWKRVQSISSSSSFPWWIDFLKSQINVWEHKVFFDIVLSSSNLDHAPLNDLNHPSPVWTSVFLPDHQRKVEEFNGSWLHE